MATTESLRQQAEAPAQPSRSQVVADMIERQRGELDRALPGAVSIDRFARVLLTAVRTQPRLLECDNRSLLAAMMMSAQTGLEPGPLGLSYLTPRRIGGQWQVVWVIGYRGILDLAHRSGRLAKIEAHAVHEADLFDYEYGSDAHLHHRPADGERGEVIGAYCLWRTIDGDPQWRYMARPAIDRIRAESASSESAYSPWNTHYAAMARKTPVRASMPYLPLTVEAGSAIAADEKVHTNLSDDMLADQVIDVEEVDTDD